MGLGQVMVASHTQISVSLFLFSSLRIIRSVVRAYCSPLDRIPHTFLFRAGIKDVQSSCSEAV